MSADNTKTDSTKVDNTLMLSNTDTETINALFQAQLTGRNSETSSLQTRLEALKKLQASIVKHEEAIIKAGLDDSGKSRSEMMLTELFSVYTELNHTLRHLKKWLKPKRVKTPISMLGTFSKTILEPKGRVLIMAPWNYPFNLTIGPLISAIAAGNQIIVKPSEMAPAMANIIETIVSEVFDPEDIAIVQGDASVAEDLLKLPFDHIYFTGSSAIGKVVMAAAAKNLTDITLELGGKSPVIVDKSANIEKAARNIVWGKFINNGQTCIAPDYLLVDASIKEQLLNAIKAQIEQQWQHGEAAKNNSDYGRIINKRHHGRLQALYDDAIKQGASVICGGDFDESTKFISPTLLDNINDESRISDEEIFGPLFPIHSYQREVDAIAHIQNKPKPLALYVYAEDQGFIQRIVKITRAGDTCINQNLTHFLHPNLPFGGVNNSGIGKGHGETGVQALSHQRSILNDKFSITHWLYPPYTPTKQKLIEFVVRKFS
jgi:aldehyde dehydrogenase (NAD+)